MLNPNRRPFFFSFFFLLLTPEIFCGFQPFQIGGEGSVVVPELNRFLPFPLFQLSVMSRLFASFPSSILLSKGITSESAKDG